ncbi:unnamed protein product [Clonostachys solani]|uniref:Uncharacterized protein n=1 Tax=Clonostachys solani TaxID=160281 RepID=A0A9N9ZL89_9HYPO|nr:unnamed protein product [Clonostachys solani]
MVYVDGELRERVYAVSEAPGSDKDKDEGKDEVATKENHENHFRSKGNQIGAHYTISRDCTAGREAHCIEMLTELATRNLGQSSLSHEDLRTLQARGLSLRDNLSPAQHTFGMEADTRGREKAEERKSVQPSTRFSHPAPPILGLGVSKLADMKHLSHSDLDNAQQSSSRGYDTYQDKDSNTAREQTLLDGIHFRSLHYRQADIDLMSPPLMKNRKQVEGKNGLMEVSPHIMLRPKAEGAFARDQPLEFNKKSPGI